MDNLYILVRCIGARKIVELRDYSLEEDEYEAEEVELYVCAGKYRQVSVYTSRDEALAALRGISEWKRDEYRIWICSEADVWKLFQDDAIGGTFEEYGLGLNGMGPIW